MALQHNFIDEITPDKETWRIKVRIIHVWKRPVLRNPSDFLSIEMLLMDEKGNKIEANVKKLLIKRFSSQINEGRLCTITNFEVGDNNVEYRSTDHKYKISFLYGTTVKGCENLNIPLHGFSFIPFDRILSRALEEKLLIDVIGEVVGVGSIQKSNKDGKELKRLELELEDASKLKVKCTLWDSYAEKVSKYVSEGSGSPIILIMQLARLKYWNGQVSLSNTFYSTKLIIDGDMDEVMDFKNRLGFDGDTLSQRVTQLSTQSQSSYLDEFVSSERKFVAEIRDIRKKCRCVTLATVSCIQTEYNWFYPSCGKCGKKVKKDGNAERYFCEKCDCHVKIFKPRYKVQVKVFDETGNSSFVMFDQHVTPIIQKSALNLRENLAKKNDIDAFPDELNVFVGKRFLFLVEITDYNLLQEWPTFTVVRMTDDEAMISKFLNSSKTEEDNEGDCFTSNESDSIKALKDVEKEATTYTGDSECQSDFCFSSPLGKRSSETTSQYAYDDEGAIGQSSSNKTKVVKVEKEDN